MTNVEKTVKSLEFYRIREMLERCCAVGGAKALAQELAPAGSMAEVRKLQEETSGARFLITIKGHPSFGAVKDPRDLVSRAVKGSLLSPGDLLDIAGVLRTARSLISYIKTDKRQDTVLDGIFFSLTPDKFLEDKITKAIIAPDMISDEASTALSDIRRKIKQTNIKIRSLLQSYVSEPKYSKYLQESIITVKNGRYVIPVRSEYRNEINGFIHDTSASGATVFIEPASVINANNDLRVLQSSETHEIEKILAALTADVAASAVSIVNDYNVAVELSFIFARAELSFEMKAEEPVLTDSRHIILKKARHPLIDQDKVVPISLSLGTDFSTLVVTGPNTGGKTVTLKTIGLLSMMVQSGLQVPVESGSVFPVFEDIFVDIGDEQSVEMSLSTFSSHMKNIISFIPDVTEKTLVLTDELGAGTDPVEGAALAVSILEEFRSRGALCAATTHYPELKTYALNTKGVSNASCEFDVETLKPTFRLIIGAPGRSNAFEISSRLGLPSEVIERAKALISDEDRKFESTITSLESARMKLDREREELLSEKADFEQMMSEKKKQIDALLADAKKDRDSASDQAKKMVDSARASSDFIFAELDKIRKKKDSADFSSELESARNAVREELKNAGRKADSVIEAPEGEYVLPRKLMVGDEVVLASIGTRGVVTAIPDRSDWVEVQAGIIKTKVKKSEIRLILPETAVIGPDKKKQTAKNYTVSVNRSFNPEIDVRGQNGEDAWIAVDKFLDDARVSSFQTVKIIHGKGTGALKKALWGFLKNDSRVSDFRQGEFGDGDSGVTIVKLK